MVWPSLFSIDGILTSPAIGGRLAFEGISASGSGVEQTISWDVFWHAVKTVFEWSNLYLALPLGIAGFAFAICQILQAKAAADLAEKEARKAKSAAELAEAAAIAAADTARSRFKVMSVMVLLTQLKNLEEAVEQAIEGRAKILTLHLLQDWRWQASECREYLDESVEAEEAVMKDIQKSVTAATNLKPKILAFDLDTDWAKETQWTRKTMADVTARLGALTAVRKTQETS